MNKNPGVIVVDQLLIGPSGVTNTSLVLHFGVLVGKFPMTFRTTNLECLAVGKLSLDLPVCVFAVL